MSVATTSDSTEAIELDQRDQIRAELETTRDLFMELASKTNDANWRNRSGNPAWTVGQMLGHIVMYFGGIPWMMKRVRQGKGAPGMPAFLFDRINALATRLLTRKYTPQNIAAAYDEAHQSALETLESVRDDEWALSNSFLGIEHDVADFFHYHARHVREHEPDIRAGL
jgi:hypothetical protein